MAALMLEPGSDKVLLMLAMASSRFYFSHDLLPSWFDGPPAYVLVYYTVL